MKVVLTTTALAVALLLPGLAAAQPQGIDRTPGGTVSPSPEAERDALRLFPRAPGVVEPGIDADAPDVGMPGTGTGSLATDPLDTQPLVRGDGLRIDEGLQADDTDPLISMPERMDPPTAAPDVPGSGASPPGDPLTRDRDPAGTGLDRPGMDREPTLDPDDFAIDREGVAPPLRQPGTGLGGQGLGATGTGPGAATQPQSPATSGGGAPTR